MSGIGKLDTVAMLRRHGLLRMPVHTMPRPGQVSADAIRTSMGDNETLVVRTGAHREERNLPRLIGVDAEAAADWVRSLPPAFCVLIQPYDQVIFSVELAVYDGLEVAEIVPGIWELDNQLSPLVVQVRGDHVDLTAWNSRSGQRARFHDRKQGYFEMSAQVDDWQIATVVEWIRTYRRKLIALQGALGNAFGLKAHYSSRFGLSPQNLRTTVPHRDAWSLNQVPSGPAVTILTSANAAIPDGPLLLDVSIAREQHAHLNLLLRRLCAAGTSEVFLRSGLLSHLAINLRESGISVRSAHG